MTLNDLVKDAQIVAVVCNQYGDTGKGKFSDYFAANWADVIARGTGGANAGHTVVIDGKERIFHLIPAGIAYDKEGKTNILGNGCVIHLKTLIEEMDALDNEGCTYNHLMISKDANVVLPFHLAQDSPNKSQAQGGIGTTGRGIGPCYADKIARRGIMIADLYDPDKLAKKLKKLAPFYPQQTQDLDAMSAELREQGRYIRQFMRDTVAEMHRFIRTGSKVVLEGAQGVLLSIEHGTYPYVTSSDCSVNGTATGVGISAKAIDIVFGIVKFPYMTRVGGGPFPTEFGGKRSEEYCADVAHNKRFELEELGIPFTTDAELKPQYDASHQFIRNLMNCGEPFSQGIGVRLAGREYGATTGRARRTGWTDAVAGRYAVGINGPMKLILTKVDVLTGMQHFKLCHSYKGSFTFSRDPAVLDACEPLYETYDGWSSPIEKGAAYGSLPHSLQKAIEDFEKAVGAPVAIVSTGPDQKDTIVR